MRALKDIPTASIVTLTRERRSSCIPDQIQDGYAIREPVSLQYTDRAVMAAMEGSLEAGLVSSEEIPAGSSPDTQSITSPGSLSKVLYPVNPEHAVRLDREPVTLSWKDINVLVPMGQRSLLQRLMCESSDGETHMKQILANVNGTVKPGTLLAIMGASGAGKSTLMNVLAHRNIASVQVSGTVMVNNRTVGLDINTISAYVQQEDLFIGKLTVREHLTFQALLRMEKHFTKQERLAKVEQIIDELGLRRCADTLIGIPGRVRGISGGEKKRLSFASEVLTDPAILFADEPTSGLDAFMAQSVVATLQSLAKQGRTVVCTIHQPSSEVYAMFDSILLLAEGRVAFLGPAFEAIPTFADLGYSCPPNFNPADYFVHTLAVMPGLEEQSRQQIKAICDIYDERQMAKEGRSSTMNSSTSQDSFKADRDVILKSPYKASWCKQFTAVLWRSWLSTSRDRAISRIRVIQNIAIGLIVGLIYFQTVVDTTGVQNISGFLFFLVTTTSFSNLASVTFVFPMELPVFIREHKNGMYRTDVYFLCKTLVELPVFLLSPLILITISYWMIGLRADALRFLLCYAILALTANVAVSYGYVVSTLVSTVQAAGAISTPLMLPLLLLGGFYLKNTTVPVFLIWVQYISWFQYAFELLNLNQWRNYGQIENCAPVTNSTEGGVCIPNGQAAIKFLGLNEDNLMHDIYAMIGLIVAFRLLAFLFLLKRAYEKQ